MSYETERATREWDREVDLEAARLIRQGTPPFEATRQAQDIVSNRRKANTQSEAESISAIKALARGRTQ